MKLRRLFATALAALLAASLASPAYATPRDTTIRTIQDLDGDNLLEYAPGEEYLVVGGPQTFRPPKNGSILNFLQLSDFQLVDEESPGRVEFLDWTQRGVFNPFSAAYRPHESLSSQITEAMVRAVRNTVSPITSEELDLTIVTGDNADSQQFNETRWYIDILDGQKKIDPNSGIPTPACPSTPGSVYDGVRGGGKPMGYYEPDASGPGTDGDGYSPERSENQVSTGDDVTVRDFPGLLEAANQPFQALGIDMPWYTAFGNHDALVQGNSPEAFFSPLGGPSETMNPAYNEIVTGCQKPFVAIDPADPFKVADDGSNAFVVPPDPRRCYLAKDEPGIGSPAPCSTGGWVEQHFMTTGTPAGHGFAAAPCELTPATLGTCAGYGRPASADHNNDGYYSFTPERGLRFVVLDTVTDECGAIVCSEGSVDDTQFEWLRLQAQAADLAGEYVVVFSHHTIKTTRFPSTDPTEQPIHYGQRFDRDEPSNPQAPSVETLEELYCENPNVIAHIAGHEHANYTRHYKCEQDSPPATPGPGDFWFVSTAAHLDWPQQARMIEFIDNGDGTLSMVLTVLDHAGPPNPGGGKPDLTAQGAVGGSILRLASIARELGYNDYQNGRGSRGDTREDGKSEDRNVIAIIDRPWPYPTD